MNVRKILYGLSTLFLYPESDDVGVRTEEMARLVEEAMPGFAIELDAFAEHVNETGIDSVRKYYASSFGDDGTASLLAGTLVPSRDGTRETLISNLKVTFTEYAFTEYTDPPDHIAVLLQFLAQTGRITEFTLDLINKTLIPALNVLLSKLSEPDED